MTVANPNLTPELSSPQAEALTTQICEAVTDVHALILRAQDGRADRALGYESWQAYVDERFPVTIRQVAREMRPQIVAEMRAEGRSLRAIASTLGVSQQTVMRDASTVPDGTVPERVTGLDGKSRPATRPPPAVPEPALDQEELDAIRTTLEEDFELVPHRRGARLLCKYRQTTRAQFIAWAIEVL